MKLDNTNNNMVYGDARCIVNLDDDECAAWADEGRVKLASGRPWSRGVPVDLYPTAAPVSTARVKTISSVSQLFD